MQFFRDLWGKLHNFLSRNTAHANLPKNPLFCEDEKQNRSITKLPETAGRDEYSKHFVKHLTDIGVEYKPGSGNEPNIMKY
jgi:hypothetical protein